MVGGLSVWWNYLALINRFHFDELNPINCVLQKVDSVISQGDIFSVVIGFPVDS